MNLQVLYRITMGNIMGNLFLQGVRRVREENEIERTSMMTVPGKQQTVRRDGNSVTEKVFTCLGCHAR